jgi:hypothetical protein
MDPKLARRALDTYLFHRPQRNLDEIEDASRARIEWHQLESVVEHA